MVDKFCSFHSAFLESIRLARCFDCGRSNTGFHFGSLEVQIGHNDALPSTIVAVGVLSHVVLSCRRVLECSRRYRQCLYGETLSNFRLAAKGLRKPLLSIFLSLFAFQTSAIKIESLRISPKPLLDRVLKKVWV